jgi:TRAP-type C4-dicarboxylate transport system permease small subunit
MIIYLIISATLIGLPFVQKERGHVNVDLIPLALSIKPRFVLAVFTLLMSIFIISIVFWHGFEFWHIAYSRGWTSDTIWAARLWIPYVSMPIGFGLLLLQLCADLAGLILKTETPFGLEVS